MTRAITDAPSKKRTSLVPIRIVTTPTPRPSRTQPLPIRTGESRTRRREVESEVEGKTKSALPETVSSTTAPQFVTTIPHAMTSRPTHIGTSVSTDSMAPPPVSGTTPTAGNRINAALHYLRRPRAASNTSLEPGSRPASGDAPAPAPTYALPTIMRTLSLSKRATASGSMARSGTSENSSAGGSGVSSRFARRRSSSQPTRSREGTVSAPLPPQRRQTAVGDAGDSAGSAGPAAGPDTAGSAAAASTPRAASAPRATLGTAGVDGATATASPPGALGAAAAAAAVAPTSAPLVGPSSPPPALGSSFKIRLVPHLESARSLRFNPIEKDLTPESALLVGRFTDRQQQQLAEAGADITAGSSSMLVSADDNRVAFRSKVVSRRHAEITCDAAGKFYIRDIKSSSGTFLNHLRLSRPSMESKLFPIKDGDILQLGVDYQGGTQEIYRAVKLRVEANRGWQRGANAFNTTAMNELRALSGNAPARPAGASVTDCYICLYPVTICQALFIAPCSHVTHFKCIRPLIQQNYPGFCCPLCRSYADLEEDVEIDVEEAVPGEGEEKAEGEEKVEGEGEVAAVAGAAASKARPASDEPSVDDALATVDQTQELPASRDGAPVDEVEPGATPARAEVAQDHCEPSGVVVSESTPVVATATAASAVSVEDALPTSAETTLPTTASSAGTPTVDVNSVVKGKSSTPLAHRSETLVAPAYSAEPTDERTAELSSAFAALSSPPASLSGGPDGAAPIAVFSNASLNATLSNLTLAGATPSQPINIRPNTMVMRPSSSYLSSLIASGGEPHTPPTLESVPEHMQLGGMTPLNDTNNTRTISPDIVAADQESHGSTSGAENEVGIAQNDENKAPFVKDPSEPQSEEEPPTTSQP